MSARSRNYFVHLLPLLSILHPSNSGTRFHRVINFQDEPRDHRQRKNGVGKTLTTLADSGTSRKRLFREISRREPSLFKLEHSPVLKRILLICHVSSIAFLSGDEDFTFHMVELKNSVIFFFSFSKKIIIEINIFDMFISKFNFILSL